MYDHVILISLDTLRSDCVGVHPQPSWTQKYSALSPHRTPVLNEIARGGVFFSNCISAAPYTSASHATFFTGKWPLKHGVYEFFNRQLASRTLFSVAREAGYRTVFKVDFPIILGPFLGFTQDVDDYIVEDDERALSAIRDSKRSLSFLHFGGIHVPYGFHNLRYGGDVYRRQVEELEQELPEVDHSLADQLVETYRDPEDTALLLRYKRIVEHHYVQKNYAKLFSLYQGGIEHFLEYRFKAFFDRLIDMMKGKRYLVVLFGDHGEEYDSESYGHFNSVSEGVLQVPVMFFGNDVKPSIQSRRMRSIDVAPTLLDMWGLPSHHAEDMNGVSLAATVREGAPYEERIALAQAYTNNLSEFVSYQRELLATNKKTGSLRNFLYKEVAYDGGFRLIRQRHTYASHGAHFVPCPHSLRLERQGAGGLWRPVSNTDVENRLLLALDAYNAGVQDAPTIGQIQPEIRQQLENMGYKV